MFCPQLLPGGLAASRRASIHDACWIPERVEVPATSRRPESRRSRTTSRPKSPRGGTAGTLRATSVRGRQRRSRSRPVRCRRWESRQAPDHLTSHPSRGRRGALLNKVPLHRRRAHLRHIGFNNHHSRYRDRLVAQQAPPVERRGDTRFARPPCTRSLTALRCSLISSPCGTWVAATGSLACPDRVSESSIERVRSSAGDRDQPATDSTKDQSGTTRRGDRLKYQPRAAPRKRPQRPQKQTPANPGRLSTLVKLSAALEILLPELIDRVTSAVGRAAPD